MDGKKNPTVFAVVQTVARQNIEPPYGDTDA
jgi:hypothetical protein